ncbi:MAG: peptidase M15 [Bacteroidales bacterium]|nr:peptidase M15 [Bacteroidales bacterium]
MADFRYFSLDELCASDVAEKRKIKNFPSFTVVEHLSELTAKILEPLREAWGSAIYVTSGYRCDALNRAVGGVSNSVHRLGWAADLQPGNGKIDEFIKFTEDFLKKKYIAYDQIIDERVGKTRWLHVGIRSSTGSQRRQNLTISK